MGGSIKPRVQRSKPGVTDTTLTPAPEGGDSNIDPGKSSMPKSHCNLLYHLVFSTKDRRLFIDDTLAARLHEYLGGAIRKQGEISIGVGGTEEHVHMLAKLHQDKKVSDVLRDIKSGSSGWIHDTFKDRNQFEWQAGYGVFTVSASQVAKVQRYIAMQAEHHRNVSFKEEFTAMLDAHGIEYDEKYLWGQGSCCRPLRGLGSVLSGYWVLASLCTGVAHHQELGRCHLLDGYGLSRSCPKTEYFMERAFSSIDSFDS